MFIVEGQKEDIQVPEEQQESLFRNLPFPLPELTRKKRKGENSSDLNCSCGSSTANSGIGSSTHSQRASHYVHGQSIILNAINNPRVEDIDSPRMENDFYPFFSILFKRFFSTFGLPYTFVQGEAIEGSTLVPDFKIYKSIEGEETLVLIVEVKHDHKFTLGEHQTLSYSTDYLNFDKQRFFILSMVCSLNQFAIFCTFRQNESFTFVQLTQYDSFSFGTNALGLLKLLYILELPWPMYGSMVVKEDGVLSVLKEKGFLGSGSSAEVYEYVDNDNKSKAVKFFRPNCSAHFLKEVRIYQLLKGFNVSLIMEWYNSERLMVCTDGVRNVIQISTVNKEAVTQLYMSLETFHKATSFIHKDIYNMNILQSSDGQKLFLNDFGLARKKNEESPIEGNPFFASDRVLQCQKDKFVYEICDDIFSLTFSFIYLKNEHLFSDIFKDISIFKKKEIIEGRNRGIQKLSNSEKALNALKVSEKGEYLEAAKLIIECFF
jgi:hypothetical protein